MKKSIGQRDSDVRAPGFIGAVEEYEVQILHIREGHVIELLVPPELARSMGWQVRHRYGALAPVVTEAANSSPLADRALCDLAQKTARGVQLLAPLVGDDRVQVATTGGLGATSAFTERLARALAGDVTRVSLVPVELDALRGAATIALRHVGRHVDQELVRRLRSSQDQDDIIIAGPR